MPDLYGSSSLSKQDYLTLKQIILAAHLNVRKAGSSVLDAAMRAGDALRSVRDRKLVRHGQIEEFYRETCSSVRTARDYITLSENRELVLTQIGDGVAELGIGAALRLVRKAKGTKGKRRGSSAGSKGEPPPKSLADWTDAEIADALSRLGYSRFCRVIPPSFRPMLARHAAGQILRAEQARHPNLKLKNINPVQLVVDNTDPETPPTQH